MGKTLEYERAAKLVLAEHKGRWSRRWTARSAMNRAAESLRLMQAMGQDVVNGQMTPKACREKLEQMLNDPEFMEAADFMERVQQRARLN